MSDGSEKRAFFRTLWAGETRVSSSQPAKRLWLNNLPNYPPISALPVIVCMISSEVSEGTARVLGRAGFVAMAGLRGMQQINCDGCGRLTPSYDIVSYGSIDREYRQLCSRCFNTELAKLSGLDEFEHAQFEPVVLTDVRGETHEFHFRTHLFGTGVSLEAFKLRDGHPAGYQFQVIGDPEGDLLMLLGRLIEKMRRALSVKHVEDSELGLQIAEHQTLVRGLIECDEACDGRVPLLVIDGREITWEEFGRMLMTFEGWQFKLEVRDMSEEL